MFISGFITLTPVAAVCHWRLNTCLRCAAPGADSSSPRPSRSADDGLPDPSERSRSGGDLIARLSGSNAASAAGNRTMIDIGLERGACGAAFDRDVVRPEELRMGRRPSRVRLRHRHAPAFSQQLPTMHLRDRHLVYLRRRVVGRVSQR